MTDHLLYDLTDGVATITLNRPRVRNAVTMGMMTGLIELLDHTDTDDDVRAVVITGAGRGFCSGADLSGGADTFSGMDPASHRDPGGLVTLRIFASLKPVIAAVNGDAIGFGATMTLPMDFRIVADTARYGFVFAARGVVPEGASSWFLPQIVGPTKALDWMLTGRLVGADEALTGGLATSVHPAEDVLEAATAVAREIATNVPPLSAALTRQLVWQHTGDLGPAPAHLRESEIFAALGSGADSREAVAAFLARREPAWTQRLSEELAQFAVIAPGPEHVADTSSVLRRLTGNPQQ